MMMMLRAVSFEWRRLSDEMPSNLTTRPHCDYSVLDVAANAVLYEADVGGYM